MHYLAETSRQAEKVVRGLGKTHRSGQASAPIVRVCRFDGLRVPRTALEVLELDQVAVAHLRMAGARKGSRQMSA